VSIASLSQPTRVPFWLVRLKNFMATLLKNKLAATGFFFLVVFIFLAFAAPLLTPYNPSGSVVSGKFNAPDWVSLVNGPSGYSKNIAFSGLSINQSGSGLNVISSGQTPTSVNLHISSASQPGTVQVVETLTYPYLGAPRTIAGLATFTVSGMNENFTVTVYLERVGEAKIRLWSPTQINATGFYAPSPAIDSSSGAFNQQLGLANNGVVDAASYLFAPRVANYNYVMLFDIPSQFTGTIKVTGFSMTLLGNTWGILGTDSGGHDIFTQLVYGARLSLLVGLVATAISIGFGLVIGLMAGYLGKVVDEVLMRFTDMLLVIPNLPLLIVLVATIGPSLLYIILFLGFFGWQGFARVVRSQVLSIRERPFIEAAKAAGAGTGYIAVRHVFPNIVSLTYVSLALSVPAAIVGEAALSFLGLGDPTTITWGQMLQRADQAGINTANLAWWWIIPPGVAIALISLSFILLGYAMDELFNPRLRRRR
jgi:ABC-type dipeptide/oligopeptide/nickel transport system permease subunit